MLHVQLTLTALPVIRFSQLHISLRIRAKRRIYLVCSLSDRKSEYRIIILVSYAWHNRSIAVGTLVDPQCPSIYNIQHTTTIIRNEIKTATQLNDARCSGNGN
jgi:hypothetical protein